jgi:tripartite-type tricarboxylate transporter receptor subunit TctC
MNTKMNMTPFFSPGLVACLACLTLVPSFAVAQRSAPAYPIKPVRLLVGFSAGSGTDNAARLVAQNLAESLGQQFIVENRPGSGGMIATEAVAKAAPDGYTLLMMAAADSIQPAMRVKMPYDLPGDFSPIAYVATGIFVVTVHPSVPARDVRALVDLARANPGKLNYASSGVGSSAHFAGELFNYLAKVKTVAVPYKGSPQAALGVVTGEVDFAYPTYTSARPLLEAGRLRALAVTTAKRSPLMAQTPTLREAGLDGYDRSAWYGVLGPRGMSDATVLQLADAIANATNASVTRKALLDQGLVAETTTPVKFAELIRREVAQNIELGRIAGLRKQ